MEKVMNNTQINKTAVRKESVVVTRNIALEGVHMLRAEKCKSVYEIVYEVNSKTNKPARVLSKKKVSEQTKPMSFKLTEVTPEKLKEYRKNGTSSFVLKEDGILYHAEIPNNISFVSSEILGPHRCAKAGHECHRLSAASDENGGCAKVRDMSTGIERYPWITAGYETFNTNHDVFCVVECHHYRPFPPRNTNTVSQVNEAKLSLAQFVWPEVETLREAKIRKEKNRLNHPFNLTP